MCPTNGTSSVGSFSSGADIVDSIVRAVTHDLLRWEVHELFCVELVAQRRHAGHGTARSSHTVWTARNVPCWLAKADRGSVTRAVGDARRCLEMIRSWPGAADHDNCEHLIRSVAGLVSNLLAAGSELRVLATSPERLHARGERVVPVAPLPAAGEAVVLLVDGAAALRPSFVAEGENRNAVTRICEHLGGLPLALELAAARTVAMTPPEIGPISIEHRSPVESIVLDSSPNPLG